MAESGNTPRQEMGGAVGHNTQPITRHTGYDTPDWLAGRLMNTSTVQSHSMRTAGSGSMLRRDIRVRYGRCMVQYAARDATRRLQYTMHAYSSRVKLTDGWRSHSKSMGDTDTSERSHLRDAWVPWEKTRRARRATRA